MMSKTERAVRDLVTAIRAGDGRYLRAAITNPAFDRMWVQAMQQVARLGPVPKRTQTIFRRFYVRLGHYLRVEIGNDLALVDALRVLLPPYDGPAVTLYRGEGDGYLTSLGSLAVLR